MSIEKYFSLQDRVVSAASKQTFDYVTSCDTIYFDYDSPIIIV